MGPPRHGDGDVGLGLLDQGLDKVEYVAGNVSAGLPQIHAELGGYLVIAGAPGPQSSTELGADPVDQSTLQRGVHVLVVDRGPEHAGLDIGRQLLQTREHGLEFVLLEQTRPVQHPGMRP